MTEDFRCPCEECNRDPEPPPSSWTSAAIIAVAVIVIMLAVGSCWA